MRSASLADWILRRIAGKQRAAAIVGDLVEIGNRKGTLWFWLSVVGVVASLVWRPALGLVAGFCFGGWLLNGFAMVLFGVHAQHRPPVLWLLPISEIVGVGTIMCATGLYAAICYGLDDRVARYCLALGLLFAGFVYGWWHPVVLTICIVMTACALGVAVKTREGRKTLVVLIGVIAAGIFSQFSARFLTMQFADAVSQTRLLGGKEWPTHPVLGFLSFCIIVAAIWVPMGVCTFLRRRAMGNTSVESGRPDDHLASQVS